MTRWDRGAWALGVAAVVALSTGVALAANDKPAIEVTRFPVAATQTGAGFAECGRGERALGGGLVQGDPTDGFMWASGPLSAQGASGATGDGDKPKRWYGAGFSGDQAQAFRVSAICAPHSKATIEATRFTADYRVPTVEFAQCGQGERAVGGGVVPIGPPDFLFVLASGPLDASGSIDDTRGGDAPKQWRAVIYNADDDGRVFKVFAVCVPHSEATIEASRFTVDEDQTGEGHAKCERGERALGGGVAPVGSPDGLNVRASGPLDSSGSAANTNDGDAAKEWFAAAVNGFAGDDRVIRVFAICRPGT